MFHRAGRLEKECVAPPVVKLCPGVEGLPASPGVGSGLEAAEGCCPSPTPIELPLSKAPVA